MVQQQPNNNQMIHKKSKSKSPDKLFMSNLSAPPNKQGNPYKVVNDYQNQHESTK